MRLIDHLIPVIVALGASCAHYRMFECQQNTNCNLGPGGFCQASPSMDQQWCSYPDSGCASGYRYSDFAIGDRECVPMVASVTVDAATGTVGPPLPSCMGLAATCGANGNDSCCQGSEVQGGTYYRSYDVAGDSSSGTMSWPATISSFRLDKYEVTVGRFRKFVEAGMGTQANPPVTKAGAHPNIVGSGWDASWNTSLAKDTAALIAAINCYPMNVAWTDTPANNENLPMNCISWYEAMAFCAWDEGFLPTEAEWNYVATGGDQQRAYPWSIPAASLAIDGSRANYSQSAVTSLVPVGAKPAGDGRWGQSDLAGNVSEWTLDWFATYQAPCTDCAQTAPAVVMQRVFRGGGFTYGPFNLRSAGRNENVVTYRFINLGVRCARAK